MIDLVELIPQVRRARATGHTPAPLLADIEAALLAYTTDAERFQLRDDLWRQAARFMMGSVRSKATRLLRMIHGKEQGQDKTHMARWFVQAGLAAGPDKPPPRTRRQIEEILSGDA